MTTATIGTNQTAVAMGQPTMPDAPGRPASRSTDQEVAFGNVILLALERNGPATPHELARETGVSDLIIRSVLQALTAVGCLHFQTTSGRYSLFCDLPSR